MTFNLNKPGRLAQGKSKSDLIAHDLRQIVVHGLAIKEGAGYKVMLSVAWVRSS